MGQANSATTDNLDLNETIKYQDFVKNYHFIRKTKDLRYGDISLLQDKSTKELVALREIVLDNDQDFQRNIELLRARSKISHPNIVKVLRYTSKPEDIFRASVHKILIIVEYLENDLEKEIKQRKLKNDYYKEEQLWYLLENVLKMFSTLQKNDVVHGDLKPSSILISKMGVYKISQPGITSTIASTYKRLLTGINDGKSYFSPNLLASLQKSEPNPEHNAWKSDVFSLGMVLLHTATLNSCDNLYNWKNKTLNLEEFEQRLSTLKILYSDSFQKAVRLMLTQQEDQRPDFVDLETTLFGAGTLGSTKSLSQPRSSLKPKQTVNEKLKEAASDRLQEKKLKPGMLMKALQENKQNVQRCNTSPVTKPIMNKDAPSKPKEQTALHQGQMLAKSPSKLIFAPHTGSPNYWDKNKARVLDENMSMKVITEPHQNRFMTQTTPKEKVSLNREASPNPLSTVNFTTQSEFSESEESTQAPPVFPASLTTIKNESRTAISSLNDIQTKDLPTSPREEKQSGEAQYKSLISSEVAQLMADFKNKIERNRSPANTNLNNSSNQDHSGQQKENMRNSEGFNYVQGPNGKMLKTMMNEKSVKYTGTGTNGPTNLSINTSAQKDLFFQNPYNLEGYSQNQQPDLNNIGKRGNSLTRSWQAGSPKPLQAPQTNNFFVPNNSSNFTPKIKQRINYPTSPTDPSVSGFQGSPANSFDPNRRTSNYQAYLAQQQSPLFERSSLTYNQNLSNINISSLDYSNKRASLNSNPYALAPRSPNQNFYEEPSDNYGLQPKESIKHSCSPNSSQMKQFLLNPSEAEIVTEKFSDGSVYKGQKKNGLRHGKGTFSHSDGGMYTGDWYEGVMEGQGTLYYAGGCKAYVGQWQGDKFHGKGAVYNEFPIKLLSEFDFRNFDNVGEHWVKYEGDFLEDNKQGTGTLFLTNGEKFHGQFREDMVEGMGIFYTKSGKIFKGQWWQNKLIRPL